MTTRPRGAIVTGAARGIGAATVMELASAGWSVLAVDIADGIAGIDYPLGTDEQLEDVAKTATQRFGDRVCVEPYVADVRDDLAMAKAVERAEAQFGGLDTVVAAAGVVAGGRGAWETSTEAEAAVLGVNLQGVLNLARHAVPAMLRRPIPRQGRFIAVASAASIRGLPGLAAYSASKAGVVGFVRALAAELGPTGITANAVSPGSTDTAILEESSRLYGLESRFAFAQQQPIGRLLEPKEVARTVAYLASDSSAGITGTNIPVDGGLGL